METLSKVRQYERSYLIEIIGEAQITILDSIHDYEGEIDSEGKACGEGVAIDREDPAHRSFGTFLNNERHGICE